MAPMENGNNYANGSPEMWPAWLDTVKLEKAVSASVGEFERIVDITPTRASGQVENYSSQMLRLRVEVELRDGSNNTISFVLKVNHTDEAMANVLNMLQLFPKEDEMYHKILPKFEHLFAEAGKEVKFAPRAFKFDRDGDFEYVLLEDLRTKNYKNANRVVGLDMEHMKKALEKLAQFHAASACYVEHYGMFGTAFTEGVFRESNRTLLKEFNMSGAFLTQLKKWKNCLQYYEKLADSDDYLVDRLLELQKVNPREFNVLNHGDCWANNIMFQYDGFGKIKNAMFVDFQVGKYGSPANDLYYLILSSATMDIKLVQFDYMVRFYYDNLVESLKLMQYHRPLPKLKGLHAALLNNGLTAYMVVSKVLPVVMLEQTDNAQLENYIDDESKMKAAMFSNPKYVKAMTEIMPWLDNRGLLDFK